MKKIALFVKIDCLTLFLNWWFTLNKNAVFYDEILMSLVFLSVVSQLESNWDKIKTNPFVRTSFGDDFFASFLATFMVSNTMVFDGGREIYVQEELKGEMFLKVCQSCHGGFPTLESVKVAVFCFIMSIRGISLLFKRDFQSICAEQSGKIFFHEFCQSCHGQSCHEKWPKNEMRTTTKILYGIGSIIIVVYHDVNYIKFWRDINFLQFFLVTHPPAQKKENSSKHWLSRIHP